MINFFHLIILDASGSMSSIRRNALSGCNETIQTIQSLQQKSPESRHFVTLVSFNSDDHTHRICDNLPVGEVHGLTEADYIPNGCTPLYDCMGLSICHLQDDIKRVRREDDDTTTEAIVTIITDGMENSSTIFDSKRVHSLVEECKEQGWTFAFIGANIDEVMEAGKLGIHNTLRFEQSEKGTRNMFCSYADSLESFCMPNEDDTDCESRKLRKESGFFKKKH